MLWSIQFTTCYRRNQLFNMEKFLDKKYKFVRSDENYDKYLEAIGLNIFNRKLAKTIPSTTQLVKLGDDEYSFNIIIPFKTHQQKFVPGEESENETVDGRKIINIFTIDANILIERQIERNREVKIVREYFEDEMLGESFVGDLRTKFFSIAVQ